MASRHTLDGGGGNIELCVGMMGQVMNTNTSRARALSALIALCVRWWDNKEMNLSRREKKRLRWEQAQVLYGHQRGVTHLLYTGERQLLSLRISSACHVANCLHFLIKYKARFANFLFILLQLSSIKRERDWIELILSCCSIHTVCASPRAPLIWAPPVCVRRRMLGNSST